MNLARVGITAVVPSGTKTAFWVVMTCSGAVTPLQTAGSALPLTTVIPSATTTREACSAARPPVDIVGVGPVVVVQAAANTIAVATTAMPLRARPRATTPALTTLDDAIAARLSTLVFTARGIPCRCPEAQLRAHAHGIR